MTTNQGFFLFIPIGRSHGLRLQFDAKIYLVGLAFSIDQPVPGVPGHLFDACGLHLGPLALIGYRGFKVDPARRRV